MRRIVRMTMCAAAIVFATSLGLADDKDAVREIPVGGLVNFKSGTGTATAPTPAVIASAEELAKNKALLKDAPDAIKKQIDFEKEKLVLFFWGSSNRHPITPDPDKPGTFTYTTNIGKSGGFTAHAKLFVVPKDAEVKVTEKKK